MKHTVFGPRLKVLGTALTASFVPVGSFTDDIDILMMFCSCNQLVQISLDNSTVHFELDGESLVLDLKTNNRQIKASTIFYARATSTIPTSGSLRISAEIGALK